MKMKMFNFLSKIATTCKIWLRKLRACLIMEILFLLRSVRYFRRCKTEFGGKLDVFIAFKNQAF